MARRGENIRKRKDGRWEGRYTVVSDKGSKSKICSVYAKSYHEVKHKLYEAKQAAIQNDFVRENLPDKKLLFTNMADEWLNNVSKTKKYSTYIKYKQIYETYLEDYLKDKRLSDVTKQYVETLILPNAAKHLKTENISESLIKSILCVLNQVFNYVSCKYNVRLSPISRDFRKKSGKKVKVFKLSEQKKLLEFLNRDMDIYKFGILLCLNTGLRLGELCALKWSDIDMENRLLCVNSTVQRLPVKNRAAEGRKTELIETDPKSFSSKREIPINDKLFNMLVKFKHSDKYIIGKEKAIDPRTYQKKFASYLKSGGIEYQSFHTLRHTFASNCAAYGADAKLLSEILGHSNVQITLNCYVHPSLDTKRYYLNMLSVNLNGQKMGQVG